MKCNRCFNEIPDHFSHCPYCGEATGQTEGAADAAISSQEDSLDAHKDSAQVPGMASEPVRNGDQQSSQDTREIPTEEVIYRDDYQENYHDHLEEGYTEAPAVRPSYYTPDYDEQAESFSPQPNYETSELQPGEYYYTESGDRYLVGPKENLDASVSSADSHTGTAVATRERPIWPRVIMIVILLMILVAALILFLLPKLRSKSPFDEVIKAIEVNDEARLAQLLNMDEYGNTIDTDDLQPFFNLLQDPAYRETLLTDLKAERETDIIKGGEEDNRPVLRRYPIRMTIDPPPALVRGTGFTNELTAETNNLEIGPWLPGDYLINVRYLYVFGEKEDGQDYKVRLSYLSKYMDDDTYLLDVPLKVVSVEFDDEFPAADIVINGKKIGKTVAEVLNNGGSLSSVVKNSTITLVMNTAGGPLESAPVLVASNGQNLTFKFNNAYKVDSSEADSAVYLNGEHIGDVADFAEFGYLIAPNNGSNEVTTDGAAVEITGSGDDVNIRRPDRQPADDTESDISSNSDRDDGSSDGGSSRDDSSSEQSSSENSNDSDNANIDGSRGESAGDSSSDSTGDSDTDDHTDRDDSDGSNSDGGGTNIDASGFPYSEADLRDAANGYISKPIQDDVLKAV
ncbi:MAG TPA: hypothetical protein GX717_08330, partial [Clostridiaceae bacterium]|nr:hypothetical protein [Clostridiaceae bacterium]